MRRDATGAGCGESLCSPALVVVVVEQLEGAGKMWADGGPMTRTAPFNSAGAAALAYRPRTSHRHDA